MTQSDHAKTTRSDAPADVKKAVAHHHKPRAQKDGSLVSIVHVSDVLCHALDLSCDRDELVPPLSDAIWKSLGIGEAAMMQILKERK